MFIYVVVYWDYTEQKVIKMDEKQQEELKERTKFKAQLRNTEKKEILETEIYLEYNESLENIHIVIHDLAGTTDKFYSDFTEIECSGEETEDEIMQYLVDFWESRDFPFEFFFMPEIPGIVKLGEREYLVYELKTEQKLSYKEIAHILKIEESTVRHHYRNAKAKVEKEGFVDGTFFFDSEEKELPPEVELNQDLAYSYKYKIVFEAEDSKKIDNSSENVKRHVEQFITYDKLSAFRFAGEYY